MSLKHEHVDKLRRLPRPGHTDRDPLSGLHPGDPVTDCDMTGNTQGMVIAVDEERAWVLWSADARLPWLQDSIATSDFKDIGYVFAPYVPLIVTSTIFPPEDFTPRYVKRSIK